MSVIDRDGVKVPARRKERCDRDAIERSRDIFLVKLRSARRPWREIGQFLSLSHEGARKRYHAIPAEVREHYRRTLG